MKTLRVAVFVVNTVREQMRYDTPRIVVEAGKPFEVIVANQDMMPHNLTIVNPGTRPTLAAQASNMRPDQLDGQGRAFMPSSPDILAGTRLLEAGQTQTLKLTAPRKEGDYDYFCTYPGHWEMMWGRMVVTSDVDAYLAAHPDFQLTARRMSMGISWQISRMGAGRLVAGQLERDQSCKLRNTILCAPLEIALGTSGDKSLGSLRFRLII